MKSWLIFALGASLGAAASLLPRGALHLWGSLRSAPRLAAAPALNDLVHTQRSFEFVARGPMQRVAPLFGADAERAWAPGWAPQFAWPAPAADREGMVFLIEHPHGQAIWVNTELDPQGGRYQYVYVIPGKVATRIRVVLSPDRAGTRVTVDYQRTALDARANALVEQMAGHDAAAGPEWEEQVNGCLARG